LSTRTRKFCPERALCDPRERLLYVRNPFDRAAGPARDDFRGIFRALWRRGLRSAARRHGEVFLRAALATGRRGHKVCSPASRQVIPPHASEWSRGGRVAKFSSVRVGVCEGAKRGEDCGTATCEVLFGSAARSAARRRAKFSSARAGGRERGGARSAARRGVRRVGVGEGTAACRSTTRRCGDVFLGACRRGRRLGGLNSLQVHSPASWRCVPRRVSAWAKAWWPVALSTSGGQGRNWAAQWHLTRTVGKRFRGCRASASMLIKAMTNYYCKIYFKTPQRVDHHCH